MYSVFSRENRNGQTYLHSIRKINLAGRKRGLIPNLLKEKFKPDLNPPIGWVLPVSKLFNQNNQSVIIDIKPKNKKSEEVFLCELDSVYGYSYNEWSPVMYCLKRLYSNISLDSFDKNEFPYPENPDIIYTMLYLAGSFKGMELIGTWNYPGPSPTNAVLLWPQAMTFFYQEIRKSNPNFLNHTIKSI